MTKLLGFYEDGLERTHVYYLYMTDKKRWLQYAYDVVEDKYTFMTIYEDLEDGSNLKQLETNTRYKRIDPQAILAMIGVV